MLAASTIEERPQLASAPSELVTPLTARRRVLGFGGHAPAASLADGPPLVVEIEVGPALGQQFLRRDAADRVLRHGARHVDGALGQRAQRGGREVGRGDEGLALAHEHAQAEVAALAALELLALAHALGDGDRLAVDVERVGRIGAGGLRPFQQVGEQVGVRRARRTLPGGDFRADFCGLVFFDLAMTPFYALTGRPVEVAARLRGRRS